MEFSMKIYNVSLSCMIVFITIPMLGMYSEAYLGMYPEAYRDSIFRQVAFINFSSSSDSSESDDSSNTYSQRDNSENSPVLSTSSSVDNEDQAFTLLSDFEKIGINNSRRIQCYSIPQNNARLLEVSSGEHIYGDYSERINTLMEFQKQFGYVSMPGIIAAAERAVDESTLNLVCRVPTIPYKDRRFIRIHLPKTRQEADTISHEYALIWNEQKDKIK